MFRSQRMLHYNLVMPRESSWEIMNGLGELGIVGVLDSQPQTADIQRPFANQVRSVRCDDMVQRIEGLHIYYINTKLISQYKKPADYGLVISYFQRLLSKRDKSGHSQLDEYETWLHQKVEQIEIQTNSLKRLREKLDDLQNIQKTLDIAQKQLGRSFFQDDQREISFKPHVGLLSVDLQLQFQRVVFRITKGRAYVSIHEFDTTKSLYIMIYLSSSKIISDKLNIVCSALAITQFDLPADQAEYFKIIEDTTQKIFEIQQVIGLTQERLKEILKQVLIINEEAECSMIEVIKLYAIKERTLYVQLNKLKMQGSLFIGDLWIPNKKVDDVQALLHKLTKDNHPSGQLQLTPQKGGEIPPTYFRVNEFTKPFQLIVDTYGVPRYQEFNPAIITCMTFPFLFGVMFGDLFHGSCLIIFSIVLCWKNKVLKHVPLWQPLLEARYMLLLMGFFSTYNGLIYNDFAGMNLNIFGSCYDLENTSTNVNLQYTQFCTYSFGIDPVWEGSLNFVNSLKMKLSVIIAYLHMTLGLILMALNARNSKNKLGLTCKFIPQFLFLTCTFGYMDVLIIIKWLKTWDPSSSAPSVINTMITMVLQFGSVDGEPLYDGQAQIQLVMILVAIICVPWMWLPQILVNMYCIPVQNESANNPTAQNEYQPALQNDLLPASHEIELQFYPSKTDLGHPAEQEPIQSHNHNDLSEVIVHESIETIEFVLGCVSNTASYLRLWALSLAHSQLAEVFYSLILADGVNTGSAASLIFSFPFWAFATVGVLLFMDTMECFLHALRLHWVEFQNKFYKGDGVAFEPYSYVELYKMQKNDT